MDPIAVQQSQMYSESKIYRTI